MQAGIGRQAQQWCGVARHAHKSVFVSKTMHMCVCVFAGQPALVDHISCLVWELWGQVCIIIYNVCIHAQNLSHKITPPPNTYPVPLIPHKVSTMEALTR